MVTSEGELPFFHSLILPPLHTLSIENSVYHASFSASKQATDKYISVERDINMKVGSWTSYPI